MIRSVLGSTEVVRVVEWVGPDHTRGSSVLWLDDGDGAVFVGDLLHTPLQLSRPCDSCAFDLDPAAARRSRKRIPATTAEQRYPRI